MRGRRGRGWVQYWAELDSSLAAGKVKRGGEGGGRRGAGRRGVQSVLEGPGQPGKGAGASLDCSAASPEDGGGREEGAGGGGGGRRAVRLFVVRFDPEGEPETLTFLA